MVEQIVYTSKSGLPPSFLYGFAFSNTDVVLGSAGYAEFIRVRDRLVEPGGDGGYLVINKTGEKHVIGTDSGGYTKIYYFSDGQSWAFSNSYFDLAEHLKSWGKAMTLDPVATFSLLLGGALGEQPIFHRSPIHQIRLLPRNKVIEIRSYRSKDALKIVDLPTLAVLADTDATYEERLRDYINTLTGRFCTMIGSDIHLISDVTGGLDSRVCLSLIMRASRLTGSETGKRFFLYSNVRNKRDIDAASVLAGKVNLTLNSNDLRYFPRYSTEDSYRHWMSRNLYGLWPLRFPGFFRTDRQLWICGNGGEVHRWIRWRRNRDLDYSLKDEFALQSDVFPRKEVMEAVWAGVAADSAELALDPLQPSNSILRHYRNFRERFHHGRRAETINSVAPLSDIRLEACSRLLGFEDLTSAKVLADVIHNCAPVLNGLPFKSPDKFYAGLHPDKLVNLGGSESEVDMSGRVFSVGDDKKNGKFSYRELLEMFAEEFQNSLGPAMELGIIGSEYASSASRALKEARQLGRFSYPPDSKPIVVTILAGKLAQWL